VGTSHMSSTPNAKEMTMRNPTGWLLLSVAELLDRNLIMVPDVDLPMHAKAGPATALNMERQIPNNSNHL
jgi:hypothetical protein